MLLGYWKMEGVRDGRGVESGTATAGMELGFSSDIACFVLWFALRC